MKKPLVIQAAFAAVLAVGTGSGAEPPPVTLDRGVDLSWSTTAGKTYQLQWAATVDGPWTDIGSLVSGDGNSRSHYEAATGRVYRIVETTPGSEPVASVPVNGGFELGTAPAATNWSRGGSHPPVKSTDEFHSGAASMRCSVPTGAAEALVSQSIVAQGGTVAANKTYEFSFWVKQTLTSTSFIRQYQLEWVNASNAVVGGTGFATFSATTGNWQKITVPNLVSPAGTVEARLKFRLVTGAEAGAQGEVFIDDVSLDSGTAGPGGPPVVNNLPVVPQVVSRITWPSKSGVPYRPASSTNLTQWNEKPADVIGDGGTKEARFPMTQPSEFYRIAIPIIPVQAPANLHTTGSAGPNAIGIAWTSSPTAGVTGYRVVYGIAGSGVTQFVDVGNVSSLVLSGLTAGETYSISVIALGADGQSAAGDATITATPGAETGVVALFNASTPKEPAIQVETSEALITYMGDRARDRHAREGNFHIYDHYLTWYWEERTIDIEIIDRVGKNGGNTITFNYVTGTPLSAPEFRAFFRGINTVAEYHGNYSANNPSTNHYNWTLTTKLPENRNLQVGDRVEIEISQFLAAPTHGRTNYYGTTFLYIVGKGVVPWEGKGALLDSFPLPEKAWLGGLTSLPYQYSNEPEHRFKQTAGNISPKSIKDFMNGRRLHHTDFSNGVHSEDGNPVFTEHIGKLGPKFIAKSCVECHTNNGRSLPPAIGAPMTHSVVKVGSDAMGSPHPQLGSVLQPQAISGSPEAVAMIASYITSGGQYGDGSSFSLQKPVYSFTGVTPAFFSTRLAPQLVGLGLLEAVSEDTIASLADPQDANADGISGRMQTVVDPQTGDTRMGRFTSKAGKARISHQIAGALNTDMGITTSIYPTLDGASSPSPVELSDTDLDLMDRYISVLGVGSRRDLEDTGALHGEQLFSTAKCVQCHVPEMQTGPHHPISELRNQTIRPFTDLLLHDMGSGLADNMGEANAAGSEWRTPPLWNIGLTAGVSGGEAYLHDGRARTLEEAILWHGGEGEASKEAFRTMSAADRADLIKFLKSL